MAMASRGTGRDQPSRLEGKIGDNESKDFGPWGGRAEFHRGGAGLRRRTDRIGRRGHHFRKGAGVDRFIQSEERRRAQERRVEARRQRCVQAEDTIQPPGRADLAAARKMLGVARGGRILAQPAKPRAGFGGAKREALAQTAGEDGFGAIWPAAQDLVDEGQACAGAIFAKKTPGLSCRNHVR